MPLRTGRQPLNDIRGSCADAKAAEKRGALDDAGIPSKDKYPGFTRPQVAVHLDPSGVLKFRGSWVCNQDGSQHPTREVCFQNCRKAGLGGPAIVDCIGSTTATQKVRIKLDFSQQTFALRWLTTCAEGKRWNRQIRDHEKRHRKDNAQIARRWRARNTTRTFRGEGDSEQAAIEDLQRQMGEWSDLQRDALLKEMKDAGKEFHATPAGAPAVLDCAQCP